MNIVGNADIVGNVDIVDIGSNEAICIMGLRDASASKNITLNKTGSIFNGWIVRKFVFSKPPSRNNLILTITVYSTVLTYHCHHSNSRSTGK